MSWDLLRAHADSQQPALWWAGRWHSYAELDMRAARLATRLRALGVRKGDRVGILAANHIAHLDLLLAAPRLGYIHTPFNFRLPAAELDGLIRYIEPSVMLADADRANLLRGSDPLPLDGYEDWLRGAEPMPYASGVDGEDVHMILFTGGSTGSPKGAMLPYRQTVANCRNTGAGWGLRADDCSIVATPCFHAAVNAMATPLLSLGARGPDAGFRSG